MIALLRELLSAALALFGAALMLIAAVGIIRMPDVFLRMSATSKASSLGVSCMLLAVAVSAAEISTVLRAGAAVLFVFLTAPVASHMIGRAAYLLGTPLWRGTVVDDLAQRSDPGWQNRQPPRDDG